MYFKYMKVSVKKIIFRPKIKFRENESQKLKKIINFGSAGVKILMY